jgi:ectoine hydroxylase-related dioxygenase (phytanoyl-CoA dioxygenase family)
MLAVRVQLDDCTASNGPLQVLSGSHRFGKLGPQAIDERGRLAAAANCVGDRGSIVAFKPLLLHRSSRATEPGHRRVIHVEFAASELPAELD